MCEALPVKKQEASEPRSASWRRLTVSDSLMLNRSLSGSTRDRPGTARAGTVPFNCSDLRR